MQQPWATNRIWISPPIWKEWTRYISSPIYRFISLYICWVDKTNYAPYIFTQYSDAYVYVYRDVLSIATERYNLLCISTMGYENIYRKILSTFTQNADLRVSQEILCYSTLLKHIAMHECPIVYLVSHYSLLYSKRVMIWDSIFYIIFP